MTIIRSLRALSHACGLALSVVACSDKASGVPWKDYTPTLRGDLGALAETKDCAALQTQFDTADANGAATMSRTGHNNADLMKYIDGLMRDAGCYG